MSVEDDIKSYQAAYVEYFEKPAPKVTRNPGGGFVIQLADW